jgi:hypothetical protein
VKVGESVKRLHEVKRGDLVGITYQQSLIIENRAPTAEELASPTVRLQAAERAKSFEPPAGAALDAVKSVVTVVKKDTEAGTVTVKTPTGEMLTVHARDPKNLERIKSGDTIVVTYLEAVAVHIEPK